MTGSRAGHRHDRFIKRNTSKIYNGATAMVTGVPIRDFNSGLKVMRRELANSLEMYGELHRYIPVLAVWGGFRVSELDVAHHERRHGTTKFGRARDSGGASSTSSRSSSSPPTPPARSTSSAAPV